MQGIVNRLFAIGVKKKVLGGYFFMSMLIFVILAFIAINFLHIKDRYDSMNIISADIQLITELKSDINGIRASFLRMAISRDPDIWQRQEEVIQMYSNKSDENLSKLKQSKYSDKVFEMERSWAPFKQTIFNELIPLVKAGKVDEAMNILGTVQAERSKEFMSLANEIIETSRADFSKSLEDITMEIKGTTITVIIFVLITFTLAFAFSFWFINKYVVGDLLRIERAAKSLAEGDLTVKIEPKSTDEFGILANKLNDTIAVFNTMIKSLIKSSSNVIASSEVLKKMSERASEGTKVQFQQTSLISESADKMIQTIVNISNNSSRAEESTIEGMNTAERGKEAADRAIATVEAVNQTTSELSTLIENLSNHVGDISGIATVIKDIADQTNLLALNAAIEAARAGEQGRGFAVVADEVRKLAEKTIKATVEIGDKISSIRAEADRTTTSMSKASDEVAKATDYIRNVGSNLQGIVDAIKKAHKEVASISEAVHEHSAGSLDVSVNIEKTLSVAREMENMTAELSREIQSMNTIAEELKMYSNKFKTT